MSESVDVIVVGMGPGGESAAAELAGAGLEVIGIEANLVGGECPYYGCIPTKMMIRAAGSLAEARRVPELAGSAEVRPDYRPVADRIRDEATTDWDDTAAVERFEQSGGRLVRGRGRLTAPDTVRVEPDQATGGDPQEFRARTAVLLNTGTDPAVPPVDGLADTPYWTNRDAIAATEAPESMIVVGGGPIGSELAQAFARFGTRVTLIEMADRLLPNEEPESGALLAREFEREGLSVRTGQSVDRVEHDGSRFSVTVSGEPITAERLLVAAGRRVDLAGLGLDSIGIDTGRQVVDPDDRMRIADGVYAVGDITGKGAFTHMSMYQASIATAAILGRDGPRASYHAVPRVAFTDPEIGSVGLTETQATDLGLTVATAVTELENSSRGFIHKTGNAGLIKLIADQDRGVLVGATAAGPSGGEILGALAVAVHGRVPVDQLKLLPWAFPTFHRAIGDALDRLP